MQRPIVLPNSSSPNDESVDNTNDRMAVRHRSSLEESYQMSTIMTETGTSGTSSSSGETSSVTLDKGPQQPRQPQPDNTSTRTPPETATKGVVPGPVPSGMSASTTPDKYSPIVAGARPAMGLTASSVSGVQECDYDLNPTVLYQAIEAKQWDYAVSLFTKQQQEDQASTWVIRKETNGKLRWRLLPLHAAIIFGSPLKLVELLLTDYPPAAQSKDDQGMLPLHLAFRNEAHWEVIDELLTAYPMAVFVCDRKGRTPLQCGTSRSSSNATNASSSNSSSIATIPLVGTSGPVLPAAALISAPSSGPVGVDAARSSFRAVVSVLELYSQIAVSGERKRAEQEARTLANTSITQLQDVHLKTLTALKKEWETQQTESKRQTLQLENDRNALTERVAELELELADKMKSQLDMEGKLRRMNLALNQANDRVKANNPAMHQMQRTNQMLRMVTETLVEQQKTYHSRVEEMLTRFQELVTEREKIRSVFLKETTDQQEKEMAMVELFQTWFREHGRKIAVQERSLEEEKKVEDVLDLVSSPSFPPSGPRISSGSAASTSSGGTANPRVPPPSSLSSSSASLHRSSVSATEMNASASLKHPVSGTTSLATRTSNEIIDLSNVKSDE